MAVHNEGDWVREAIRSIQGQTFADWELLATDDGSKDGCVEAIRSLAEADARIKVTVNERQLGLAASLNRLLVAARGEFVARMDGDDVCVPDRLAREVEFLASHLKVDVVGGGAFLVDARGQVVGETFRPERHEEMVAKIYKENPFIHPTVMARRAFFVGLGGYDSRLKRAQDYDLWLRGYRGFRYANLRVPLVYYRVPRPSLQSACYSARVLLRAARRDSRLLRGSWYCVRPLLAYALTGVRRRR